MSTPYSCARPYAAAVFKVAKADELLQDWHAFLQTLASIMSDQKIKEQLNNPKFTSHQLESLLLATVAFFPAIKEKAARFIATLKKYHRFVLLTEISEQYAAKLHQFNHTSLVHVTTAVPATPEWLAKLEQALISKLNCQVTFACDIDEAILAGAVIRVGDQVIDASVRNKLTRLLEFLLR